jgi:hypothetical protein
MTGAKRASIGGLDAPMSRKKACTSDAHAAARAPVKDVLDVENYELPEDDNAILANVQALACCARYLKEQPNSTNNTAAASKKTLEQLEEAAEKIRRATVAGIKKQMTMRLLSLLLVPSFN